MLTNDIIMRAAGIRTHDLLGTVYFDSSLTVVFNKNVAQSVEHRALGTLEMATNEKIDLKKIILRSYLHPH